MSSPLHAKRVGTRAFLRGRRAVLACLPPAPDADEELIKLLVRRGSAFSKSSSQTPVLVCNAHPEPLLSAIWVIADGLPDTLQVSFLDMVPQGREAFACFFEETLREAKRLAAKRIVFGLNGHVNNGFGLAVEDYEDIPCFGTPSNPAYYAEWIRLHATATHKMLSYRYDIQSFTFGRHSRFLPGLFKRYRFRYADFGNLKKEISIYTALNNAIFRDHPFYYARQPEEDYELFQSFRWLLKPENFIVAMDKDVPVGFLLWYPDFHELVSKDEKLGVKALWRYRIAKHRIRRCKIAEIGVIPSYQSKGVALGMMAECFDRIRNKFEICETGWILDENTNSKGLNTRWLEGPSHSYEAYEVELKEYV